MPKVEPTDAVATLARHTTCTSEGEKEDNPRWYRQAEGLLRKHAKDLSAIRYEKQKHKTRFTS